MAGSNRMSDLKLFAALGPGDIVGARRARIAGNPIKETSIAFSEQLFSYCRYCRIKTLAISSNDRVDQLEDEFVAIENRPKLFPDGDGIRYHLSQVLYAIYLVARARRFGADIAIVDSGTTHYFALAIFRMFGIPIVVNLHNVLWPSGFPPKTKVQRIIRSLNTSFFRYFASGAIGVSPECERQVLSEGRNRISFHQYRCQFLSDGFRPSRAYEGGPFRIAFVGRAEEDKGVLDIAQIAAELRSRSPVPVVFDVCGDGSARPQLEHRVKESQLCDVVIVNGRLERADLLNIYQASHAVIVPTRSSFAEGMPQVCAEAMLSCLPVITSQVSNAFDVIGPAIAKTRTDEIETYVEAILSMIDDPILYGRMRSACLQLSLQFLNRAQSYPAAIDRMLALIFNRTPLIDYRNLFDRSTRS
jgi:glycogen(starch) synthase